MLRLEFPNFRPAPRSSSSSPPALVVGPSVYLGESQPGRESYSGVLLSSLGVGFPAAVKGREVFSSPQQICVHGLLHKGISWPVVVRLATCLAKDGKLLKSQSRWDGRQKNRMGRRWAGRREMMVEHRVGTKNGKCEGMHPTNGASRWVIQPPCFSPRPMPDHIDLGGGEQGKHG